MLMNNYISKFLAEQVYGDQNMHDEVRRNCMDYMVSFAFLTFS